MTRKTAFFEGWFWFKFNNLGLTLGTNLKFYTSLSKGLKLKVRKFSGLTRTFIEVTGEKLDKRGRLFGPNPILNRVKAWGNSEILEKYQMWVESELSAHSSFKKLNVDNSCQKTREIRYYIFEVLSKFTVFLYFVSIIFFRIN